MQTQWSQVEDQEAQWISWNDSAVSTAELHASSEFTSRSSVEWREGVRTRLNTLWLLSMNGCKVVERSSHANSVCNSILSAQSGLPRAVVRNTPRFALGTNDSLWTDNQRMLGWLEFASTNVPSNLPKGTGSNCPAIIAGALNELVIRMWRRDSCGSGLASETRHRGSDGLQLRPCDVASCLVLRRDRRRETVLMSNLATKLVMPAGNVGFGITSGGAPPPTCVATGRVRSRN